jgi:hypothetical protein
MGMISRLAIAGSALLAGVVLFAPSAPAQGRGMHGTLAGPRSRPGPRRISGAGFTRRSSRRFFDGAAYVYPPYFYGDDEYEYEPEAPPPPPNVAQPSEQAPVPHVVEPLILENHSGEWVRVPNSSQLSVAPPEKTDSPAASSSLRSVPVVPASSAAMPADLPPAVLVFRDGHTEEIGKYMIEGDLLYTNADYWSTGSWSRKIPLSQVDIPASLKINQERGSKFNLPSKPNEIVVRF